MTPTPSLRAHVARCYFCWDTTDACDSCANDARMLARVRAAMPTETRCYARDPRPSDRSPRSAGV